MAHLLFLQLVGQALSFIVLMYSGVDRKNSAKLILECRIPMIKYLVDAVMS